MFIAEKVKSNKSINPLLCRVVFATFYAMVLVSLFFIFPVYSSSVPIHDKRLVFDNFSNRVEIIQRGTNAYVKGTNISVQLSKRLIVKTINTVTKDEVFGFHQAVSHVTELFKGTQSNFYSLTFSDKNRLVDVLFDLQKMQVIQPEKGILLVQPDILQLKAKDEVPFNEGEKNKDQSNIAESKYSNKKKQPKESLLHNVNHAGSPYIDLLNISELWLKTKGKNIKIAIIDDGIFIEHSEFKHTTMSFSYDVENKIMSSIPIFAQDTHGTKVAGIIFSAHDNKGVDGIAPEAELISIRQPSTWTSNTLLSFQLAKITGADIINCSWHTQFLLQPIHNIIQDLTENGRNGKGIVVVISAGNNGKEIVKNSTESAIENAIVVGANGKDFRRLAYSNYGSSVDLFTYGQWVKTTLSSGKYGGFSGTSLAASIVSGISALLLSHHPELTIQQLTEQLKLIVEPNAQRLPLEDKVNNHSELIEKEVK
ncbi:S8 family serine peptidase [Colwellia sp. E2M01]|uniref:S8 family peptidase n=1 Tax=Colwellia sp. E2M01 TaxID=2841561 RepID=UPI001C09C262|nr:S8 family serine peptidase [Colwellia sp. E2M01]MBU2871898.1 S8 family serine peptidase [Colwellia sp. E2M01]